jgi:hypothetical protein
VVIFQGLPSSSNISSRRSLEGTAVSGVGSASHACSGEYLEVDQGNMVVAAAALVAGSVSDEFLLRGGPIVPLPTPTADVITLAVRALERIIGAQSEWRDLWGEGDAVQGVRDLIATLQAR